MSPARLGVIAGAYLLGSVPTGYWLGLGWKRMDVREFGSGNLGATNVFRVLGPAPGLLTLLIDMAKGWASIFLAHSLFPGDLLTQILAGAAAIVGHTMSVFVRFRGGKGVATSAGVFLALLPAPSAIAIAVFAVVFALTRYVSLGSLLGALALAASSFVLAEPRPLAWSAAATALFVVWTHRANIRRLMDGTENKITFSSSPAASGHLRPRE